MGSGHASLPQADLNMFAGLGIRSLSRAELLLRVSLITVPIAPPWLCEVGDLA